MHPASQHSDAAWITAVAHSNPLARAGAVADSLLAGLSLLSPQRMRRRTCALTVDRKADASAVPAMIASVSRMYVSASMRP